MRKILEIGCGKKPYKGNEDEEVIHLDKVKLDDVEVVWNLNNFPYPFQDNEFDEVIAFHTLEHLDNLVKTMEEIWRITKNGGIVKIKVPYAKSSNAFSDPTHKYFFTTLTFDYWDEETEFGRDYYHQLETRAKFKVRKREVHFSFPLLNTIYRLFEKIIGIKKSHPQIFETLIDLFLIKPFEIYFELEVRK